MPSRGAILRGAAATVAAAAVAAVSGCGDDGGTGQQVTSYRVGAPVARFPARQQLAHPVELTITVRNDGRRTIPNLAVTLSTGTGDREPVEEAFSRRSDEPDLSSRTRPVWIVDEGPASGDTAYGSTWSLGAVPPGGTRAFRWRVVPIRAGSYTLRYRLFGDTSGRARLRLADGSAPEGTLRVRISDKPSQVEVTPSGRVVEVPPT